MYRVDGSHSRNLTESIFGYNGLRRRGDNMLYFIICFKTFYREAFEIFQFEC